MSGISMEESEVPRTPPRTLLKTPEDQDQVEEVFYDTPRNSVGNTTRVSIDSEDEDPKVILSELVEETTRTPRNNGLGTRDLEGNTSGTPVYNGKGRGNVGGNTPIIPLNLTDDEQKDPRVSTSPTTSTPGISPTGTSNGELRNSELQESEESVIESSVRKVNGKREVEDKDNVGVSMMRTSLSEKSEVEEEDQDVEDTSWVSIGEDTKLQEGGAKSCVALRTRSHTGSMRKHNLTELIKLNSSSMTDSFEIIGDKAMDSLNLPRYEKDIPEWENRMEWCDELKSLDTSMDKVTRIGGPQKQEEITERYRRETREVAKKNEDMIQNYEEVANNLEKERTHMKSVTFVVEKPKFSSALEEVINALETLVGMNLDTAPIRNIENIIKIILSICIDYSIQIKSTQETMITMAEFIKELIKYRYRMEILEDEIKKVEREKQEATEEIDNLKRYNSAVKKVADSMVNVGQNRNRDMVTEIAECRARIEELQNNAVLREKKYTEAFRRKEFYKKKTEDLEKEAKNVEAEMEKEKEKETIEKQNRETERQSLLNDYDRVRESVFRLEEKIGKLKAAHEADVANIMEINGVNSEQENGRRVKAEGRTAEIEIELRKVRGELNRMLRAKDNEIAAAKRKGEDNEDALVEKEKENKNLRDKLESQKQEMELKELELQAYKYHNFTWGVTDPKKIFDPKHPEKRLKPEIKSKAKFMEDKEDSIESTDVSYADNQSSTAGIFGDSEGCMDTTQEIQRGEKRKKMEKGNERKEGEREKERVEESSEESYSNSEKEDEKEPKKKKKQIKEKTDNNSRKGITKREFDRKIEELQKEHDRQMKEQEKINKEGLEKLKRKLEQKRSASKIENMEVQELKPEEIEVEVDRNRTVEGRKESREISQETKKVQDPQISSQELDIQISSQNSELIMQTQASQNSEQKNWVTQAHEVPSTQNREEGKLNTGEPSSQNREEGRPAINKGENRPYIVCITDENRSRISMLHKRMLLNEDGTLTITPQYWTWSKNPTMQLQRLYEVLPDFPADINRQNHPKITLLFLEWTHEGEWVLVPIDEMDEGPVYKDTKVARIESYIDLDGRIKRAVSYGKEEAKLTAWFDIDELKQAFPHWTIPIPGLYYNTRRFSPDIRRQIKGAEFTGANSVPISNLRPRNQSSNDIKGTKGNQQAPINKNNGYRNNQYRYNTQAYKEWDRQQQAGPSNAPGSKQWEQEAWDEYQQSRNQREPQNSMQQPRERDQRDSRNRGRDGGNQVKNYDQRDHQEGYFTREYDERRSRNYQEDRKRDNSESRFREGARDRQGERRQMDRNESPRRLRGRSPSPMNSGRGRGGRQREREYDTWSDNNRGRRGGYERRGDDASYGGS